MKDESLIFLNMIFSTPNKVSKGNSDNIKIERVHIGERIRDMILF